LKAKNFYNKDDYNLSDLEEKIILVIANKNNYFPTKYTKTEDGNDLHIWTLDARKATKSVSKLLKELKIIEDDK